MNYPLISEYIEAIKLAENNFATLTNLSPVKGGDGNPVMTSGNFAVVFKMEDEQTGKLYAVKCFLKDQPNRAESYKMIAEELEFVSSTFLVQFRYLDNELFVDTNNSDKNEFPVLVMDWVEWVTLDKYIRQNIDDQYALQMLAYQFSKLAMWIIPQPFAHGDIKPDNIMVRNNGSLVLIDYDGMYVPAMKGQKARELGSSDFRHPSRTENDFDEHIDDFPLISILLSLRAIANDSSLLEKYGASDRLLFSLNDYCDISSCQLLKDLYPSADNETNTLVGLFTVALTQGNLSKVSFRLLTINRPEEHEILSTEVTEEDLANAWIDEYGVKYSKDKKRLLKASHNLKSYEIIKGTKVICNEAFSLCKSLQQISIRDCVTSIGNYAFSGCESLQQVTIPNSVTSIGWGVFLGCRCHVICLSSYFKVQDTILYNIKDMEVASCWSDKQKIVLPDGMMSIGDRAFCGCKFIQQITIPDTVTSIGKLAFCNCKSLKQITIPGTVTNIGDRAFSGCSSLLKITIPTTVTSIGEGAFSGCSSLQKVAIPNSVKSIGKFAFFSCLSLQQITIPDSMKTIGQNVFEDCKSLEFKTATLPTSIVEIGDYAFFNCKELQTIQINFKVKKIGANPFSGCKVKLLCQSPFYEVIDRNLYTYDKKILISYLDDKKIFEIPSFVNNIGDSAFSMNNTLETVYIHSSVKAIGRLAFNDCQSLKEVFMNDSVTSIGYRAFSDCVSLKSINLSDSITSIEKSAFEGCISLESIRIPSSIISIGENIFKNCSSLKSIYVNFDTYSRLKRLLKEYNLMIRFLDK